MDIPIACATCGLLQRVEPLKPGTVAECERCGSVVRERGTGSLSTTFALVLAALILYIPANVYPILSMSFYGVYTESTVWEGCVSLFRAGQWHVAVIVFLASIAIPLLKLCGLLFLVATARFGSAIPPRRRLSVHKFIELIGPWAMLDVYLVAILVALVKLDELASVLPGPGLIAFAAVVVLTILASASFDPALIWKDTEESHGRRPQEA